jgi:hypothetical protein
MNIEGISRNLQKYFMKETLRFDNDIAPAFV